MSPRAEPVGGGSVPTANDDLKQSFRSLFWGGIIAATVAHFAVFSLWPELRAKNYEVKTRPVVTVNVSPDVKIPPAPRAIGRPAMPVMASTAVSQDITITPTTFEQNKVVDLPPPPKQRADVDLASAPVFTPYTVRPRILNEAEVVRAMERSYPTVLRDAGIGGTVIVYFFIDENGVVLRHQVFKTSGHPELDSAAIRVADVYRFSPALNRDKRVPVWVQFPITFTVK